MLPLFVNLLLKRASLAPLLAHFPGPAAFGLPALVVLVELAFAAPAARLLLVRERRSA